MVLGLLESQITMRRKLIVVTLLTLLSLYILSNILIIIHNSNTPLTSILIWSNSCLAGCWNGLYPKVTTEAETSSFVYENFIKPETYKHSDVTYYVGSLPKSYNINAYSKDNLLLGIMLEANNFFDLTIKDILQKLGEPQYVAIGYIPPQYQPDNSESALVSLFYPDKGFVFHIHLNEFQHDGDNANVCINEGDKAFRISIVAPSKIKILIIDANYPFAFTMSEQELENFVANLKPWSGFNCASFSVSERDRLMSFKPSGSPDGNRAFSDKPPTSG